MLSARLCEGQGKVEPLKTEPSARRGSRKTHRMTPAEKAALAIFALITVAGPLAFGAVDRIPQIALVALLAAGLLAVPPAVAPLGRWGNRIAIALVSMLVLKEFAPASWFGHTAWRGELIGNFGLELPATHNPEPARALDALLVALAAAVWFTWVRTLAAQREHRPVLAWCLFLSAAIVACVSFATRGIDPHAIYGLRYTPGWTGFGPFPNRNHTADFLAMGGVLGLGCASGAAARKQWPWCVAAVLFTGVVVAGLLSTESRGGLIAFGAGAAIFLGLLIFKFRSRNVLFFGLGAGLAIFCLTITVGGKLMSRFHSEQAGHISTATRLAVWRDTLGMWKDAPLFGHGIASFPQVFPMYQHLELEETSVLHPESSWLQWLVELGAIPLVLVVIAALLFVAPHIRDAFTKQRSFYQRAAAFAAAAVLLLHAAFDVPAHRWGTAGFALAALAVACPIHAGGAARHFSRRPALMLLAVAAFWALPFLADWPAWSPLSLTRLLARESSGADVRIAELEKSLRFFTLNPWLHHALGLRELAAFGRERPSRWQREFAIASRLVPASWTLPAAQARASRSIAPGLAIGYWQQAIERGGLHRDEIFWLANTETASWPMSAAAWARFAEANPRLLLTYAGFVPPEQARYYYSLWWQQRGLEAELDSREVEAFYKNACAWGELSQFDHWMKRRADWEERDHRCWAGLLHRWGDEDRAWTLLSRYIAEPQFPAGNVDAPRLQLETRWRQSPKNVVNAQQFAQALYRAGDKAQSDEVVLAVAAQNAPLPPPWFVHRAAYVYARQGRLGEAVAKLLAGP